MPFHAVFILYDPVHLQRPCALGWSMFRTYQPVSSAWGVWIITCRRPCKCSVYDWGISAALKSRERPFLNNPATHSPIRGMGGGAVMTIKCMNNDRAVGALVCFWHHGDGGVCRDALCSAPGINSFLWMNAGMNYGTFFRLLWDEGDSTWFLWMMWGDGFGWGRYIMYSWDYIFCTRESFMVFDWFGLGSCLILVGILMPIWTRTDHAYVHHSFGCLSRNGRDRMLIGWF